MRDIYTRRKVKRKKPSMPTRETSGKRGLIGLGSLMACIIELIGGSRQNALRNPVLSFGFYFLNRVGDSRDAVDKRWEERE